MVKILYADDDPLMRKLVEFKLKQQGFSVALAENGEQAMAMIEAERPALVVLDAMMPIMDGFEVLRRMKESESLRAIPVVMLTAKSKEQDIVGGLNMGAADYVVKPFNPAELVARIRRWVPPPETAG